MVDIVTSINGKVLTWFRLNVLGIIGLHINMMNIVDFNILAIINFT